MHEEMPNGSRSPYHIRSEDPRFRTALRTFADLFLEETEARCGDLLDGHEAYLSTVDAGVPRSRGEYAVELLAFGLLRHEFAHLAAATSIEEVRGLNALWQTRSDRPESKSDCDAQRGRMFLDMLGRDASAAPASNEHLIAWLAATGEFVQESLRMRPWLESSRIFSPEDFLPLSRDLAGWFGRESLRALGAWTEGVDGFRRQILSEGKPREDLFLVTRSRGLYHLNMVGAEVMNRGFRPDFSPAARTRSCCCPAACAQGRKKTAVPVGTAWTFPAPAGIQRLRPALGPGRHTHPHRPRHVAGADRASFIPYPLIGQAREGIRPARRIA